MTNNTLATCNGPQQAWTTRVLDIVLSYEFITL